MYSIVCKRNWMCVQSIRMKAIRGGQRNRKLWGTLSALLHRFPEQQEKLSIEETDVAVSQKDLETQPFTSLNFPKKIPGEQKENKDESKLEDCMWSETQEMLKHKRDENNDVFFFFQILTCCCNAEILTGCTAHYAWAALLITSVTCVSIGNASAGIYRRKMR